MTKRLAAAALATLLIGGDALALPAVQNNHGLEHQAQTGHLGMVHDRGHSRVGGMQVHGFNYGVQTPLDNNSGGASGKRQHSPLVFTGRRLHGVRDAASGLPIGKRMH